jgi:hypothetical protein
LERRFTRLSGIPVRFLNMDLLTPVRVQI